MSSPRWKAKNKQVVYKCETCDENHIVAQANLQGEDDRPQPRGKHVKSISNLGYILDEKLKYLSITTVGKHEACLLWKYR